MCTPHEIYRVRGNSHSYLLSVLSKLEDMPKGRHAKLRDSSLCYWASLVAQMVKRLPTMRETQVRSLGQEDPLEKERATHSSTLAWKIPWKEEPGRPQSKESQRVGQDRATKLSLLSLCY